MTTLPAMEAQDRSPLTILALASEELGWLSSPGLYTSAAKPRRAEARRSDYLVPGNRTVKVVPSCTVERTSIVPP
jgi:hypothetical protein